MDRGKVAGTDAANSGQVNRVNLETPADVRNFVSVLTVAPAG
jgi:hypothetical protein